MRKNKPTIPVTEPFVVTSRERGSINKYKKILSHLNEIAVVDFDHSDVVRHPLVSKIVKAYNNNDQS